MFLFALCPAGMLLYVLCSSPVDHFPSISCSQRADPLFLETPKPKCAANCQVGVVIGTRWSQCRNGFPKSTYHKSLVVVGDDDNDDSCSIRSCILMCRVIFPKNCIEFCFWQLSSLVKRKIVVPLFPWPHHFRKSENVNQIKLLVSITGRPPSSAPATLT